MYYHYWRYRRFLGLTQQAVSYATGIPVQRIAASERGKVTLNRTECSLIESYLNDKLQQLAFEVSYIGASSPEAAYA